MRIVLITRHFPPVVTGGARRPYLMVKGLEALGAEVRVIAPSLPEGAQGIAVPHPMPAPLSGQEPVAPRMTDSLKNWLRSTLMLPDPDIRWSLRASKAARELNSFEPDWVITTSPPESAHVAGYLTARALNARWAADFRDHWLEYPLLAQRNGALRRGVEKFIAKRLLKRAQLILAPEPGMVAEMAAYAPQTETLVLPQAAYVAPNTKNAGNADGSVITILHTGSFSLSHDRRTIDPALDLIRAARARDQRFRLVLIGRLTDEEMAKAKTTEGVEMRGVQSLEETWRAQAQADILLLVAAPDALTPPGKLAEYKGTGNPIVFIGGDAWSIGETGGKPPLTHVLDFASSRPKRDAAEAITPEQSAQKLLTALSGLYNHRSG